MSQKAKQIKQHGGVVMSLVLDPIKADPTNPLPATSYQKLSESIENGKTQGFQSESNSLFGRAKKTTIDFCTGKKGLIACVALVFTAALGGGISAGFLSSNSDKSAITPTSNAPFTFTKEKPTNSPFQNFDFVIRKEENFTTLALKFMTPYPTILNFEAPKTNLTIPGHVGRFFAALNLPFIGKKASHRLGDFAAKVQISLNATIEKLSKIRELDPKKAELVFDFFSYSKDFLERLVAIGSPTDYKDLSIRASLSSIFETEIKELKEKASEETYYSKGSNYISSAETKLLAKLLSNEALLKKVERDLVHFAKETTFKKNRVVEELTKIDGFTKRKAQILANSFFKTRKDIQTSINGGNRALPAGSHPFHGKKFQSCEPEVFNGFNLSDIIRERGGSVYERGDPELDFPDFLIGRCYNCKSDESISSCPSFDKRNGIGLFDLMSRAYLSLPTCNSASLFLRTWFYTDGRFLGKLKYC